MDKVMGKEERLEEARNGLMKAEFDLATLKSGKYGDRTVMVFTGVYNRIIRAWKEVIVELGGSPTDEGDDNNDGNNKDGKKELVRV
jgi:hypothetical protein